MTSEDKREARVARIKKDIHDDESRVIKIDASDCIGGEMTWGPHGFVIIRLHVNSHTVMEVLVQQGVGIQIKNDAKEMFEP